MSRSTRRRVRTQDEGHRTGQALNIPGQEQPTRRVPLPTQEASSSRQQRTPVEIYPELRARLTDEQFESLTAAQKQKLSQLASSLPSDNLGQYNNTNLNPASRTQHSPVMQLLADFGVTDITADELSDKFGGFSLPEGVDDPVAFLEMLQKVVSTAGTGTGVGMAAEYLMPTTPRDVALSVGGAGKAATGANRWASGTGTALGRGRPIPRANNINENMPARFRGVGEKGNRSTFWDNLAELLPEDFAKYLAEGEGVLPSINRYFAPSKSYGTPVLTPQGPPGKTAALGHFTGEMGKEGIQPAIFRPRTKNYVEAETIGTPEAQRAIDQATARRMRATGSPVQRRVARGQLEQLGQGTQRNARLRRRRQNRDPQNPGGTGVQSRDSVVYRGPQSKTVH